MLEAVEITKRETEVLALFCKGWEYKQIASELGLATHTIRVHMRSLMAKTRRNSKIKLLLWAIETRFIDSGR